MNCPSCGKPLEPTKVGAVEALACPQGHGFWLDPERARALAAVGPVPEEKESPWPQRNAVLHLAAIALCSAGAWGLGQLPKTGQVWSLQSVSQLVLGFSWVPYIAASTVLVLAMRTRRWGAAIVHGLMLATLAVVVGTMWRPTRSVAVPPQPKLELAGWSLCASADPPYAVFDFEALSGQISVERFNGARGTQTSLAAGQQQAGVEVAGGRARAVVRLNGVGNHDGWTVLVALLDSGPDHRAAMWADPGPQGLPPVYQSGAGTPARPLPPPRMECQ